jgi:protein-disulfide isomerase
MTRILKNLLTVFLVATAPLAAAAAGLTSEQKTQIEFVIRDYLLQHPEILKEMTAKLEEKERIEEEVARMEGLRKNAADVFHYAGDAVAGNAKGDVTLVEFMDYNCGWCKKSVSEIQEIVGRDRNLRIVIKEFPIFGAGSEYAARAALASNRQGKYWELHQALFQHEGQVTAEVVDQTAADLGIDVTRMKTDMADQSILDTISKNYELTKLLRISGTPAFIVDETIVPGYVPSRSLEEAVATVRENGGCKLC